MEKVKSKTTWTTMCHPEHRFEKLWILDSKFWIKHVENFHFLFYLLFSSAAIVLEVEQREPEDAEETQREILK